MTAYEMRISDWSSDVCSSDLKKVRLMKSCLVVDDSKVIRKVARHILESLQMSVSEACDGRDALTQCEAAIPDVVLLDWNMHVMSGLEFLEALSQREMDARPKLIFRTTEHGHGHIKAEVEATRKTD